MAVKELLEYLARALVGSELDVLIEAVQTEQGGDQVVPHESIAARDEYLHVSCSS